MELKNVKVRFLSFFKKYRYVALILAIGLLLMIVPTQKLNRSNEPVSEATEITPPQQDMTETLSEILSQISGAGKVNVFITYAKGEETIYQTDNNTTTSGDSAASAIDTVIVSSTGQSQTGLIRQVIPPAYLGAIVVCQGADDASVRYAIVDAVSKVTGLGADRISVLKMK